MDNWVLYSLASCIFKSLWAIFLKFASRTIDSTTSNLIQLPVRIIVTILLSLGRKKPGSSITFRSIISHVGDLSLYGVIYTVTACTTSVLASFFLGDAMKEGNASSVAVITGSYPATSYLLSILLGLETVNPMKLLGVALAIASCYCFVIA